MSSVMSSAARYFPRAPRYVFRPEDHSLLRFAGMTSRGQATHARIRDLSATGLSFVVDSQEAPALGEQLKIEFGVPGQKQIAWFATVVRVEERNDWDPDLGEKSFTVVGLRFRQLPAPYRDAIHMSVTGHETNEDLLLEGGGQELEDARPLAAFCALTIGLIIAFFFMSLPPSLWVRPLAGVFLSQIAVLQ